MNILQVLSQFEVTGAETFSATFSDELIEQGHNVYIVSDTFQTATKAEFIAHPIGKRDIAQRYRNVQFLKKLIKEKKIDVVHAHSRASSWVSFFATRRGDVPLVSSIHYRQHLHFSSMLFSIYGEKRVAVCESIYSHLNRELKYPMGKLALVHNGIDLSKWKFERRNIPKRENKIVAYVGRLTGFKGDSLLVMVEQIFPHVYKENSNIEFHIYGSSSHKNHVVSAIEKINRQAGEEFIIIKGFAEDVETIYRTADVIIGSGRVAMEALACGAPVISIGESNYVGIISEETSRKAVVTNFGDLDPRQPIDVEAARKDIRTALSNPEVILPEWGRKFVEENYDIKKIAVEMAHVFTEAVAEKSGIHEIPVLSYHKVVQSEGCERMITVHELEQQLQFLLKRGFAPLNFFEMKEIRAFKKHLPAKPIILTFDGNNENFDSVYPLLKKHGFTAVFFVQAGKELSLKPNQLKELASAGFEIGSYSVSGKKFNLHSEQELIEEIQGSRNFLMKSSGAEIISFAYPHGFVNEKIKAIVKNSGYQFAVSIDEGRRNFWADPLKIRRIQIFHNASKFSFWKKTSGWYYWYKSVY